jgi:hypothetical protein
MSDALDVTTKLSVPRAINLFLLENRIVIKDNPAISPDLTLDAPGLMRELRGETALLAALPDGQAAAAVAKNVLFYPRSELALSGGKAFIVESRRNGDAALVIKTNTSLPFDSVDTIHGIRAIPLTWDNLIALKNLLLTQDPGSTVFPKAEGSLAHTVLAIGARFTTLHWPAVAWTMKALGIPLTANQASIPREVVCDVDAMLDNRLLEFPYPSIAGSVPEGHQGQSVQGTSLAAVITYLKMGFHQHRIPWSFSVDHDPIGSRFDGMEEHLVEGGLFASHIAYDLSPELSSRPLVDDAGQLEAAFATTVDPKLHQVVLDRLTQLGLAMDLARLKRLETYLWPAMKKLVLRNTAHTRARQEHFRSPEGRRFFKELDGLPGQATPDVIAVCLAMADAFGVKLDFVSLNSRSTKNSPEAREDQGIQLKQMHEVAEKFGASLVFHEERFESFRAGADTTGHFAVKTSGRDTYDMGAALAASQDAKDQQLWRDWYSFTKKLAAEGTFSAHETRRTFVRDLIAQSLDTAGQSTTGIFDSPASLEKALAGLPPSPDHAFWIEYNFLFVLAAEGSTVKLGDHSPAGYQQRARFYGISDEGKLGFAKNVASTLMRLAEQTGICPAERIGSARDRLATIKTYADLLADVA